MAFGQTGHDFNPVGSGLSTLHHLEFNALMEICILKVDLQKEKNLKPEEQLYASDSFFQTHIK